MNILHRRNEHLQLAQGSWEQKIIRINSLAIPQVSIIETATRNKPWDQHATVEFPHTLAGHQRSDNPGFDVMEYARMSREPELYEQAAGRGITLTDDPVVDVLRVEQLSTPRGTHYVFHTTRDKYVNFLATSNSLDDPITVNNVNTTLREHCGIQVDSLQDLHRNPCVSTVSMNVVVVSSDTKILISEREASMVAHGVFDGKRAPFQVVGEGVVPNDCDRWGHLDIHKAARRGVMEEVGVEPSMINTIINTGIFFDHKRLQVGFTTVMELGVDAETVKGLHGVDSDAWKPENTMIIPLDRPDIITGLMLGEDDAYQPSSEHTQAALLFMLHYYYGVGKTRAFLR